jgi:hypothetical protein
MLRTRHSPLRRLAAVAVPLALLLALSAPPASAVATVPVRRWAQTVCPAFADFARHLQSTDELVALSPSPSAAQQGLVDALDDAIASASDVVVILRRAGVPDSRRGRDAATTIAEEFRSIRSVLGDAQALIASVSVSDSDDFLQQLDDAQNQVAESIGESYLVIVSAVDGRLGRALRENRTCRSLLS